MRGPRIPARKRAAKLAAGRPRSALVSLASVIVAFSIPQLTGAALQAINGAINQVWVSHILGEVAVAALGNANIVLNLMLGLVAGLGVATNVFVARATGAADKFAVQRIVATAAYVFTAASVVVAIARYLFARHCQGNGFHFIFLAHSRAPSLISLIYSAAKYKKGALQMRYTHLP